MARMRGRGAAFFFVGALGCQSAGVEKLPELKNALFAEPSVLSFGNVALGVDAEATFTLENGGGAALQVALASIDAPFSIEPEVTRTIEPGAVASYTVRFRPA